jgi:acetyl-CoA C-acetyltransferase
VRDVSVVGIGQTKVGEHWERSIRDIAVDAVLAALADANLQRADALYVGNMLSGALSGQENLGALIADYAGLRGIEAVKVEAACGSGAAAARLGYMAIASGLLDSVIVCGVEKMTETLGADTTAALAMAGDADYEAIHGLSFVSLNALIMRRYMHEYGVTREDFGEFAVNAHRNAENNPYAMFPRAIKREAFSQARMIADPVSLMDSSPIADGAAALVLVPTEAAREYSEAPVRILASAVCTDSVALHDRNDLLFLSAAHHSARKAYEQAGVGPEDIDLFELHDAFTIMAALSLEACGFAARGNGTQLARDGEIRLDGRIPISTMGGLKARGHPVGATGAYQLVEVVQQLRGEAGKNQLPDCRLGMSQNIGGSGATVITHILEGGS